VRDEGGVPGAGLGDDAVYGEPAANAPAGAAEAPNAEQKDADDSAKDALGQGPGDQYQAGLADYRSGDYESAVRDFNAVIDQAPRSSNYYALAMYYKGRSELNRGNARAAASALRRVVRENPRSEKYTEARYWLAKSLLRISPDDREAQQILAELMRGNTSVAGNARETYDRAFGRAGEKGPPSPKVDKRKSKDRRNQAGKGKKSAPSFDSEDSAEEVLAE
jgi:TolA-binding protein